MMSQWVERTWIRTGGYGRFRGEWVKLSWHEKEVKAIFKSLEEEAAGQGSEEASNTRKLDLPKFSLFQVFRPKTPCIRTWVLRTCLAKIFILSPLHIKTY